MRTYTLCAKKKDKLHGHLVLAAYSLVVHNPAALKQLIQPVPKYCRGLAIKALWTFCEVQVLSSLISNEAFFALAAFQRRKN